MTLSWHPKDAGKPFDWSRDTEFVTALADRRDRRTGGRRKGDQELAGSGTTNLLEAAAPRQGDAENGEDGGEGNEPRPDPASDKLDPMVTLMAVTLDEVYAAMKPAKADLK